MITRRLEDFLAAPEAYVALYLTNKNITDAECELIAAAIPQATQLTRINLDCNHIGDYGGIALATAVAANDSILMLNLGFNEITDEATQRINDQLGDRCYTLCQDAELIPEEEETPLMIDTNYHTLPPINENHFYAPWPPTDLSGEINNDGEWDHLPPI